MDYKLQIKKYIDDEIKILQNLDIEELNKTINLLEETRLKYNETKDKAYWNDMIQLLPTSYNQMRTCTLNYENLVNIYYARRNHKDRVSIITKANIIKTTDGKFLRLCEEIAKEYPEIRTTEWFIDIMTAKLVDEKRRTDFKVFILPNLYGDIITDEAAEFQGGVGTAGSANIGKRYAMFEAIHGSAPRMIAEGRGKYADPCSMLRASVLMLSHIGYADEAARLERALDFCMFEDKKYVITGRDTGATCEEFGNYVMDTLAKL